MMVLLTSAAAAAALRVGRRPVRLSLVEAALRAAPVRLVVVAAHVGGVLAPALAATIAALAAGCKHRTIVRLEQLRRQVLVACLLGFKCVDCKGHFAPLRFWRGS